MVSKNSPVNTEEGLNPLAGFHHEMNNFFDRFLKESIPEKISASYDSGGLKIEIDKNLEATPKGKKISIGQKYKSQPSSVKH
jgi:hypothetical protein